jgi:hypothetical protein
MQLLFKQSLSWQQYGPGAMELQLPNAKKLPENSFIPVADSDRQQLNPKKRHG